MIALVLFLGFISVPASVMAGCDVYLLSYPGRRFRGVVQGIGWANKPGQ